MGASAFRPMTHRFDVVPIRVQHECCIIVRVVLRAQARRAVINATRTEGRRMERLDVTPVPRREGKMHQSRDGILVGNPKARPVAPIRCETYAAIRHVNET